MHYNCDKPSNNEFSSVTFDSTHSAPFINRRLIFGKEKLQNHVYFLIVVMILSSEINTSLHLFGVCFHLDLLSFLVLLRRLAVGTFAVAVVTSALAGKTTLILRRRELLHTKNFVNLTERDQSQGVLRRRRYILSLLRSHISDRVHRLLFTRVQQTWWNNLKLLVAIPQIEVKALHATI